MYLNLYDTYPIEPVKGEGVYLFDKYGRRYLDLLSGLGVNLLGYNHPTIIKELKDTPAFLHLSNLYLHPLKEEVASLLCSLTGMDYAFFTNSGTEAIEASLKFAWKKNPGKIVAFENSFHGRTLGSLSLSGFLIHQRFPRIDAEIRFLPWGDAERLRKEEPSILILEPIQGSGGPKLASPEFYNEIMELKTHGTIIICDEIQSGLGRCGSFLASMRLGIEPDIVALGKGLGGGLPLGCVLLKNKIRDALSKGDHGTTMGGNFLALKLARVVIDEVLKLIEHVREIEKHIEGNEGLGLFIGITTERKDEIVKKMLEDGVIIGKSIRGIRLLPPLIIKKDELLPVWERIRSLL